MAKTLNRVQLLGRLGNDPDHRVTQSGTEVCTLNIATNENYKDRDGNWQERTDWHRVVLWRKLAEIANKYLNKGAQVMIEGKLQTRSYEDKSGVTKYITEVVADNLYMLGGNSPNDRASEGGPNYSQLNDEDDSNEFDDDVPF